jgi:hypothetical protein
MVALLLKNGFERFGSKAGIGLPAIDVRFTPKSRHWLAQLPCPLCAKSGHQASFRARSYRRHLADISCNPRPPMIGHGLAISASSLCRRK